MSKEEFLAELRLKAGGLPGEDLDNLINFYREMIDDEISEGKTEEDIIAEIGSVDDIVDKVAAETSLVKLVKEKRRTSPKKRLKPWEIVLIIVSFPVWFPLLIAAFAIAIALFLVMWVISIASYVVEAAVVVAAIGSLVVFIMSAVNGQVNYMYLGAFIGLIGASMIFQYVCVGLGKGSLNLTRNSIRVSKQKLIRKGEEK